MIGYVQKSELTLDHVELIPKQAAKQDYVPWKPLGGKINLTWQQVGSKNPDTSKITTMPGLNVISPQWFHLIDGKGNLKNLADAAYVKWAHAQGLQIWALFSNSFESKQTTEALSAYDNRIYMIKQLVSFAQMYKLEGINIDFENVALKDKANMVQFVRELTPFLHEQGLVVSIDVTVKDGSETYSKFMDRQAIGKVVDYMMVMTYDEHWATSPIAGSVSSLSWVENGIAKIISEDGVPASKILMGVPFFTRIWTEEQKDGLTVVTSKPGSMDAVQKIIADKKLKPTFDTDSGQNYVEFTEGAKKTRIWIEDAQSIQSRIVLLKKLDLAGAASWSRTFETPDIWKVIESELLKKP
jgi:spore germination protein YaaH